MIIAIEQHSITSLVCSSLLSIVLVCSATRVSLSLSLSSALSLFSTAHLFVCSCSFSTTLMAFSGKMPPPLPKGEVIDEEATPGRHAARVNCGDEKGCDVLLRVTYHPHWRVFVKAISFSCLFLSSAPILLSAFILLSFNSHFSFHCDLISALMWALILPLHLSSSLCEWSCRSVLSFCPVVRHSIVLMSWVFSQILGTRRSSSLDVIVLFLSLCVKLFGIW